jgi:hypothetical protein
MKSRAVVVLFGLVLGFSAAPASAQDLDLGYQFQRISCCDDSLTMPLGFDAAIALPLPNMANLSVFGQFDWSRKSESEFSEEEGTNSLRFVIGVRVGLGQ